MQTLDALLAGEATMPWRARPALQARAADAVPHVDAGERPTAPSGARSGAPPQNSPLSSVDAADWGLMAARFVACFVEMVEATTIVMAMGFTRSWRSTMGGVRAALVALAVVTAAGYALTTWLPEAALQLVIGGLL